MEYCIFILSVIIVAYVYHRIKYKNSNYGKFEYYLKGETYDIIAFIMIAFEILSSVFIGISIIYFGGLLVKYILTLIN